MTLTRLAEKTMRRITRQTMQDASPHQRVMLASMLLGGIMNDGQTHALLNCFGDELIVKLGRLIAANLEDRS